MSSEESMFRKLLNWLHAPFLLFIKGVEGAENIPQGNFLLIANHPSYLDPFILNAFFTLKRNKPISFLTHNKFYKTALARKYLDFYHCVQLTEPPEHALKQAIERAKNGSCIGVFPQGRVTDKHDNIKTGFARIASHSTVPVLPVTIKGVPLRKPFFLARVTLRIGRPVPIKQSIARQQVRSTSERVYRRLL